MVGPMDDDKEKIIPLEECGKVTIEGRPVEDYFGAPACAILPDGSKRKIQSLVYWPPGTNGGPVVEISVSDEEWKPAPQQLNEG